MDKNRDGCESLTNFSDPIVLLQCSDSGSDRFVEGLCRDLYRVLNVLKILDSNRARSEDHKRKLIIFAVCSPLNGCLHQVDCDDTIRATQSETPRR